MNAMTDSQHRATPERGAVHARDSLDGPMPSPPTGVRTSANENDSVLATGAWLKNRACLLQCGQPVWSPLHGDMGDPASCEALEASVAALIASARGGIVAVAHDLHPDFFSTRLAIACATSLGVPAIGVQHHHAHIAAVMAEHHIDEPVIGLALDGVGLGTDGTAWGGELLWVAPEGWRRLGNLWPLALPGGDVAAREPWRMAAAALHAMGRGDEIEARFSAAVGAQPARIVGQMLARGLNCPMTSSAGRWFDAAACALGLSVRQGHEAEAAIALQQCATDWVAVHGELPEQPLDEVASLHRLDLRPLLDALFERGQDASHPVRTELVEVPARLLNPMLFDTLRVSGDKDSISPGDAIPSVRTATTQSVHTEPVEVPARLLDQRHFDKLRVSGEMDSISPRDATSSVRDTAHLVRTDATHSVRTVTTHSVRTEPVEVPARLLDHAPFDRLRAIGNTGSARTVTGGIGKARIGQAAAHFHATLADTLAAWAIRAAREAQTHIVCLGGGCFANTLLTDRLTRRLVQHGLRVLTPSKNPCGDAGLALGQAWVAARQLTHQRAHGAIAPSHHLNPATHESPSCA